LPALSVSDADYCIAGTVLLHFSVDGDDKFEWDDANTLHLARHSVSPNEAEQVILDPDAVMLEVQNEGEERLKAAGATLARENPCGCVHVSGRTYPSHHGI
jgi:hypothetical protein